jgi:hypothetical protein
VLAPLRARNSLRRSAQIRPVDFKKCTGFHRPTPDQRPAAGEQVHAASEFSATENMEDSLVTAGDTNHFDGATQYDEDAVMQISRFENNFMCLRIALPAKRRQSSNLPVVQLGKHRLGLSGDSGVNSRAAIGYL